MATMNNNKPSTWVTIPDAQAKAIQDASPKTKNPQTVRNKLLWGIGFVVMVVAATILLAPKEMKDLLQGNLFESTPSTDQTAGTNGFGVESRDLLPTKTAEDKTGTDSVAMVAATGTETTTSTGTGNVVQAETAPMAIQVDTIDATYNASEVVKTEITPDAASVTKIADLQKQLQNAQKQHEADGAKIKELAAQVEQGTHSAAEESVANAQIPSSVQSTSVLGQKYQLQPRYRVNTHTVDAVAQANLQKSATSQLGNLSYPTDLSAVVEKGEKGGLTNPKVAKTPESGPSEMILIAFVLTFFGLMGWKTVRVMNG